MSPGSGPGLLNVLTASVAELGDAEVGRERREGIAGDGGAGPGGT